MSVSLEAKRTTSLRSVIERAAGMHTAPVAGTTVTLFGACAPTDPKFGPAHVRCEGTLTVGATTYICSCSCHNGPDPADWDAAFGSPWWAAQSEAE